MNLSDLHSYLQRSTTNTHSSGESEIISATETLITLEPAPPPEPAPAPAPKTPAAITTTNSFIDWPAPDEEQRSRSLRKSARKVLAGSGRGDIFGTPADDYESEYFTPLQHNGAVVDEEVERLARAQIEVQRQIAARVKPGSRKATPRASPLARSVGGYDGDDYDGRDSSGPPLLMSSLAARGMVSSPMTNGDQLNMSLNGSVNNERDFADRRPPMSASSSSHNNKSSFDSKLATPNPEKFQKTCVDVSKAVHQVAVDMNTSMNHLNKFLVSHNEICNVHEANVQDARSVVSNHKKELFRAVQDLFAQGQTEEAQLMLVRSEEYLRVPGDEQSAEARELMPRISQMTRFRDDSGEGPDVTFNVFGYIFSCSRKKLYLSDARKLVRMVRDVDFPFRDQHGRFVVFSHHENFETLINFIETDTMKIPNEMAVWNSLRQEAVFYEFRSLLQLLDSNPPGTRSHH